MEEGSTSNSGRYFARVAQRKFDIKSFFSVCVLTDHYFEVVQLAMVLCGLATLGQPIVTLSITYYYCHI